MSEMTSNVLHNGFDDSNRQVVHGDVQEMIKQLQLRNQLQEEQLEQQQHQQLEQQQQFMMQKFEELQRQLSYPRDDIPVSVEPDASQV